ncbi:MAG: homocysteine S-methyltransferase family protein [SAR324 cluster bacterium]|nr:homocysteine S-methyltransferase family protein [SAR324 cluster bacterium]
MIHDGGKPSGGLAGRNLLVADGAVGPYLMDMGGVGAPAEAANISQPERVETAHRDYLAAGARLIRSNTRYANRIALAAHNLDDRCEAINNSGIALARQAAGSDGVVMGSIGPIDPAEAAAPERERAYSEQLIFLSDVGADILLLEHFTGLEEALLVARCAKRVSDAPVLAQMTFSDRGTTADGCAAEVCGEKLLEAGADALGVSCTPRGKSLAAIVTTLLTFGVPTSVMLGVPHQSAPFQARDRHEDSQGVDRFANPLIELAGQGVVIVGGCCGVAPEHILALAGRLG